MAKITNFARGPRGISLKDGSTIWLDPGQSEDIKKDDIAGPLPDLGTAPAVSETDGDDDRVSALSAEIDSLKAQVAKFDPDGDGKTGGSKAADKK